MVKFKFIYCVSSLVTAFFILPCSSYTCIHDKVAVPEKPLSLTRSAKYYDVVKERNRDPRMFEKLKIHFYLDKVNSKIPVNAIHNVELALTEIRDYIKEVFQVRKRRKPFVLERQGCSKTWQRGKYRGKCSKYSPGQELCSIKDISFLIPARLLDRMDIYDAPDSDLPPSTFAMGLGLADSNFIVFVIGEDSSLCDGTDVSAFGSYCRFDAKTNEPQAGILNLCPQYLAKKIYPKNHYKNIILHEIFHILGFTFHLFEKYLPCEKGIYCNVPRTVIQDDGDGIARMMFPFVIKNTQDHFNCSKPDFGAPMEKVVGDETENIYSSHWHPVLMYSSIMTPKFSEYDHIFVDNITLAVFGSTGWYVMNYTYAEKFKFGMKEGCDFGLKDSCEDQKFLCDPKKPDTGCDLIHDTIGRCTSLTPTHPCGVYQPLTSESCESEINKRFGLDFYALGYKKKCFMSSEPNGTDKPSCFPVKCKSEKEYEILVNMTWYPCNMTEISVDKSTILCPNSVMFCAATSKTITQQFCPEENYFFVAVRMNFELPGFNNLLAHQSFKNFKVTAMKGIAKKMGIPLNYFANSTLSVFKKIYLDFALCPPNSLDPDTLHGLVEKAQKFLDSGEFKHILKGAEAQIISASSVTIDPSNSIDFSDHEGFWVLIILPVMCGIFLIATVIASLVRHNLFQRIRPQRNNVNEMSSQVKV